MYLVDSANVAAQPPVPKAAGAVAGWFQDENAVTGSGGTVVEDDWLNMVQGEFKAILDEAGIAPDQTKVNRSQVIASLNALFGNGGSITTNGWQRLSGGLIFQWGFGTTVQGNQDPRYFPLTFPNACFAVVVNEAAAAGWNGAGGGAPQPTLYGVSSVATNGFYLSSVRLINGAATYQPLTHNYIALGH